MKKTAGDVAAAALVTGIFLVMFGGLQVAKGLVSPPENYSIKSRIADLTVGSGFVALGAVQMCVHELFSSHTNNRVSC